MDANQMRNRIRELERQIRDLQARHDREISNMKNEMNRRINELKRQRDQILRNYKNKVDATYAQKAKEYQEKIVAQYNKDIKVLQEQEKAYREQQAKLIHELEKENEEIAKAFQAIKDDQNKKKEGSKKLAEEHYQEAVDTKAITDQLPHEFFYPSEFMIFSEHLAEAVNLIKQEYYEAAVAVCDAASMEFERLALRVEAAKHEWESMYNDYRDVVLRMRESLTQLNEMPLTTPAGNMVMDETYDDYWSKHYYSELMKQLQPHFDTIDSIEQNGLDAFLKKGNGHKSFQFLADISAANRLSDHLEAMIACIKNECFFSDERFVAGNLIADFYEELLYETIECQFSDKDETSPASDQSNLLDAFVVRVTYNRLDEVIVHIVPYREDGVTIRNDFIIETITKSHADTKIIEDIVDHIRTYLQHTFPTSQIIDFENGVTDNVQDMENVENQLKKQADVNLQAVIYERKYN